MKFKLNTLILLTAAILFAGGVYLFERYQAQNPDAEDSEFGMPLFDFSENQVNALTVITPERKLMFERNPQKVADPWQMKSPDQGPADEAAIAFLLNQMTTANGQRTLEVPLKEKKSFGLDQPTATIEVKLKDQTTHRLVLGGKDPIDSGIYAQVDPPATSPDPLQVDLVPIAFLDAVNRPLSEWEKSEDQGESVPSQPESSPSLPEAGPPSFESPSPPPLPESN